MPLRKQRVRPSARTTSLPAPTGGWNARDALGEMAPIDAVYLQNWFPATSDVIMRLGYSVHSSGITGQVETLMNYAGASADEFFAAAGSNVYDVTSAGPVGAAVVTGQTNARWQYTNVSTSGGNFLVAFNGEDDGLLYDGSAWSTVSITGVASADIDNVTLFKDRLWLTEKNTLSLWYLGSKSIAGAATEFPLQSIAGQGGYIVATGTWTIDSGYGVDDLFVIITSKGQVIVYKGTDPTSIDTWALVGIWDIGAPVGSRSLMKYSGDLIIICQDGLMPLSAALQSSRVNPKVALTDKIQWAVSRSVSSYGANFGWQTLFFPKENMLFLNVPIEEGSSQEQYVMNSITGAWCRFVGWDANCWELFQNDPYFGGNGFVGKAWDGYDDDGNNIETDGKQAFNYFNSRGVQKRFTLMRPVISANGLPAIYAAIDVDFEDAFIAGPIAFSPVAAALWDIAIWDSAAWSGDLFIQRQWQGVAAVGFCGAPRLRSATSGIDVHWISTDVVFETGGIL